MATAIWYFPFSISEVFSSYIVPPTFIGFFFTGSVRGL